MRTVFVYLALILVLSSCGRPLTDNEISFAAQIHGHELDTIKVRLVDGAPVRSYSIKTPKRPRVTCQERLFPAPTKDIVTAAPTAVALFNRILLNPDFYAPDYTPEYPEKLHLSQAMFLAHELTHVWQWQNRTKTGYHPFKAAREHQTMEDPYLFNPDDTRNFLEFGYEQQGAIVEEYICCAALDAQAPRTERLYQMIRDVMPLQRLETSQVVIPWKGAKISGICR